MEIKNNIKIHNRFDIEIVDKNTGEVKQSLVSYNIVLSQMYTRLCGGLAYFVNIHFGSGTGTLSPSRTTLFTHLGTKAAVDEEIIKAIPLSVWKRKIVLNPEEYVGNTISEVGIAFGSTNTNLVTHSLLKDSEGNTISIVKTDLDVITIYATVFVTFDTSNLNLYYIDMPSSNQLVNYLIGGSTAPVGTFGLNDVFLGKIRLGSSPTVTWSSDVANKQRKTNVPRISTSVGNGHVKYLEFTNLFNLKLPSISIFNGQNYSNVSIGFGDGSKKIFDIPSANVKQDSISLKLNGLVTNGYLKRMFYGLFTTRIILNPEYSGSAQKCGINNNGDIFVSGSGSTIYVFKRLNGVFQNIQTIILPSAIKKSCVISGDGLTIAISQNSTANKVVIFKWDGTSYIQTTGVSTLPSGTGEECKLSENGNVLAFTYNTSSPGYVVYDWNGSNWIARPSVPGGVITSGVLGIDINSDGSVLTFGIANAPYAYVYDWNGSNWIARPAFDVALPSTVTAVSLSKNGNTIAFTLYTSIYVYDWNGSNWIKRPNLPLIPTNYIVCVHISGSGDTIYFGRDNADEKVYMYEWDGISWIKINSFFRDSSCRFISVSEDKKMAVMSSDNTPSVYEALLFTRIEFETAPAIGDVITVDYTVDGVHKTDQYVIDVSFAIQFGEI